MKAFLKVLALGAVVAASTTMAKADQITGTENVTGNVTYDSSTNSLTFPAPSSNVNYEYSGPGGDFLNAGLTAAGLNCTGVSGTGCFLLVGAGPITLGNQSPAGGPYAVNNPAIDPLPIFTLTEGSVTTGFSLTSEYNFLQMVGPNEDLVVEGTGIFTLTGYDPTPGIFNFTINDVNTSDATVVGSFSGIGTVAATPEPSSLALLGTGLLSAAAVARRRFSGRISA